MVFAFAALISEIYKVWFTDCGWMKEDWINYGNCCFGDSLIKPQRKNELKANWELVDWNE